jgi:hypothetical protein
VRAHKIQSTVGGKGLDGGGSGDGGGRVSFAVMAGFWVKVLLLVVGLVSLIFPKAGSEGLGLAMGRGERRSAIGEVCRCQ